MKFRTIYVSVILIVINNYIGICSSYEKDINKTEQIIIEDSVFLDSINTLVNLWLDDNKLSWEKRESKLDSLRGFYKQRFGIYSFTYSLILHKKGVYKFYQGSEGDTDSFRKAIDYYEEALNIRIQIQERTNADLTIDIIKGFNNISACYLNINEPENSSIFINRGFRYYDSNPIREKSNNIISRLHSTAARAYMELGDYDNALKHFKIIVNDTTGSQYNQIEALNNCGGLFANLLYDPKTALHYLKRAKELIKKNQGYEELPLNADNHKYTGIALFRMSKYDSALYYFNKSLDLNTQLKSYLYIADDYLNIAAAYNKLLKTDGADIYLNKASNLYKEKGLDYDLTLVYDNKADAAFLLGKYKKSLDFHNQSLTYVIKNFKPVSELSYPDIEKKMIVDKTNILYILNSKAKTLSLVFLKDGDPKYLEVHKCTLPYLLKTW